MPEEGFRRYICSVFRDDNGTSAVSRISGGVGCVWGAGVRRSISPVYLFPTREWRRQTLAGGMVRFFPERGSSAVVSEECVEGIAGDNYFVDT